MRSCFGTKAHQFPADSDTPSESLWTQDFVWHPSKSHINDEGDVLNYYQ
jgi:hypothetical protein